MNKYSKPLLKWVGGKTQILEDVLKLFPKEMNNYHEIFIGGGSVLIGVLELKKLNKIKINKIYAYDYNKYLINFYNCIKENPDKLLININKIIDIYNNCKEFKGNKKPQSYDEAILSKESYYYWIRKEFNKNNEDIYKQSALFLFLNKTCFRGMYRTGPNGFNVPFGNYKKPKIINKNHLYYINSLIKDVEFINNDFLISMKNIKKKDFTYLDPPYYPINSKSFVKYNKNGFNLENHNNLFNNCKILNENKIKFLMSNSYINFVKNYFDKFCKIINIECKRRINSKNPDSKILELLILNF